MSAVIEDGRKVPVEAPEEERRNVPVEDPEEGRKNVPVEAPGEERRNMPVEDTGAERRNVAVEDPGEERSNVPVEEPGEEISNVPGAREESRNVPVEAGEERRNVPVEAVVDHHGETNRELQKQLHRLQKEAFQLASFYFTFQGVIFTTFYGSTLSDLRCRYRWILFTLSSVIGFLNFCALSYVTFKYKTTLDDLDKVVTNVASAAPSSSASTAVRSERLRGLLYISSITLLIGFLVIITLIANWKFACPRSESTAKPRSPAAT